ncbi:unnamed protein product [Calypogeia fissa]
MAEASEDPAGVGYPEYRDTNSARRGGRNAPPPGRPVTQHELQHHPAGHTYPNRSEEDGRTNNEWAQGHHQGGRPADGAHNTSQQSFEAPNSHDPGLQTLAGHTPSAPPAEHPVADGFQTDLHSLTPAYRTSAESDLPHQNLPRAMSQPLNGHSVVVTPLIQILAAAT